MAHTNLRNFVKNLLICSEKASAIGRFLKANAVKLSEFVEAKASVRKELRRGMDFKTIADVLIQQSIIFDLVKNYPEMLDRIYGEESCFFIDLQGNKFSMKIHDDSEEMKRVLARVIDLEEIIDSLVDLLYHSPELDISILTSLECIPPDLDINLNEYSIWIDPIDGTAQYIDCKDFEQNIDNVSKLTISGLCCCFVLIGVYHRPTGHSCIGIMNQVFPSSQSSEKRSILWGVCLAGQLKFTNVSVPDPASNNNVVVSWTEQLAVLSSCQRNWHTVPVSAAGYKFWNVICGNACAFLLTRGSCFKWDTCAPHAILKALGGNAFSLPLLQSFYSTKPSLFEPENLSEWLELTYWNYGHDTDYFSPAEVQPRQSISNVPLQGRVSICDNILYVNPGGFIASIDASVITSLFMHIKDYLT